MGRGNEAHRCYRTLHLEKPMMKSVQTLNALCTRTNLLVAITLAMLTAEPSTGQSTPSGQGSSSSVQILDPLDGQNPISPTPDSWPQLAGSSTRAGFTTTPQTTGPYLSNPDWISTGDGSVTMTFTPHAGVVADQYYVYGLGKDQSFTDRIAAFDQSTGDLVWATQIPFPFFDSWSTPSIDPKNDVVIIAAGFSMVALDRFTGDELWLTDLGAPIVNASPCLTTDLDNSNRAFITDYTFGSANNARLICINIDPHNPVNNPYQPGEIVWVATLPGDCSGNTPAYHNGIVYVSTADNGSGGAGHILAFDATSTSVPAPIWDTPNTVPIGFFSAVTYAQGFIYASSYNFNGGQRSANTIKLDANTGDLQWSVPTVRTDASPIVLANNTIIISGGVPTSPSTLFTGSLPAIELVQDNTDHAVVLWDSFEATHQDLDNSGSWDPGEPFLSIGGWGHHPIAFNTRGAAKLLVSTMNAPTGFNPLTHGSQLHTVDLTKYPTDPAFIISTHTGTGTTPALVGNRIFSTSANGLSMLELERLPPPLLPIQQQIRSYIDGYVQKMSTLQRGTQP